MDHMKNALKQKMGRTIQISIQVDPQEDKKTDLAPMVMDSEEPGVIKSDEEAEMADGDDGGEGYASEVRESLISGSPDHPAGGKTLDSIAKERAMKRMKRHADPIEDEQIPGRPFRQRK